MRLVERVDEGMEPLRLVALIAPHARTALEDDGVVVGAEREIVRRPERAAAQFGEAEPGDALGGARHDELPPLDGQPGAPLPIDALKSAQLERRVLKLAAEFRPDAVLVEYVFYSWLLELFGPEVRKIIDTHDVFTNRHQRFLRNGVEPEWHSTTRRQERKGLQRANCVIAIQDQEREFFSKLTKGKVVTVGHIAPTQDFSAKESPEPRVLLTASHNQVNRDGAAHFIEDVWPLIQRCVPGAQLELCGRICNHMAPAAGVVLSGELPSLEPAYARAWVVISPLRFGTGLKIKTIEAMAFGKATVATAVSAEGLESAAGTALRLADGPESFAAECVSLLESIEMRRQLGRRALAFVESWNARQRQSLAEALG